MRLRDREWKDPTANAAFVANVAACFISLLRGINRPPTMFDEFKTNVVWEGLINVSATFMWSAEPGSEPSKGLIEATVLDRSILLGRNNPHHPKGNLRWPPKPDCVLLASRFSGHAGGNYRDFEEDVRALVRKGQPLDGFPIVGDEILQGSVRLIRGHRKLDPHYVRFDLNGELQDHEELVEEIPFTSIEEYGRALLTIEARLTAEEANLHLAHIKRNYRKIVALHDSR